MKVIIYFISFIIITVLGVLFTALNPSDVDIDLYFFKNSIPLPFVIFLTLLLGVIVGSIPWVLKLLSSKNQIRRLKKECKVHEEEITALRNAPYKDSI